MEISKSIHVKCGCAMFDGSTATLFGCTHSSIIALFMDLVSQGDIDDSDLAQIIAVNTGNPQEVYAKLKEWKQCAE